MRAIAADEDLSSGRYGGVKVSRKELARRAFQQEEEDDDDDDDEEEEEEDDRGRGLKARTGSAATQAWQFGVDDDDDESIDSDLAGPIEGTHFPSRGQEDVDEDDDDEEEEDEEEEEHGEESFVTARGEMEDEDEDEEDDENEEEEEEEDEEEEDEGGQYSVFASADPKQSVEAQLAALNAQDSAGRQEMVQASTQQRHRAEVRLLLLLLGKSPWGNVTSKSWNYVCMRARAHAINAPVPLGPWSPGALEPWSRLSDGVPGVCCSPYLSM